ncbi:MAG: PspC domain-containing protein [Anaerolineae bacterium]
MEKRLYRSRTDRIIAGVCGGLGQYLGIDPTFLRIAFAVLAITSLGMTILVYLAMALIIPLEPVGDG